MVCHRRVLAVEGTLEAASIPFQKVSFGEIYPNTVLTPAQKATLEKELKKIGFELIDTQTGRLIEKIKQLVIQRARNEGDEKDAQLKLSHSLSSALHKEYTYLSGLFSSVEGRTIENFFIEQRIEKAKELLIYGQLSLSQIAFDLEYSSVAHLSTQFKKITGLTLTPSHFKQMGAEKRRSLDSI